MVFVRARLCLMKRLHAYWAWFGVWLCLCCGSTAWAQVPLRLDPKAPVISLAGHMEWLREKSGLLSPAAAQAHPRWQALAGELNAGFTLDPVWIRFEVEQPAPDAADWRLELDSSSLEDVRFYQPTRDGGWIEQRAGVRVTHNAWPLDTRSPTFQLLLPPGHHRVMLRLQSRMPLVTGIRLWPAEGYQAHARHEALGWGVYLGMFAMIGLFQFVFWMFAREAISAWYLPYAFMIFLLGLLLSGYLQNIFNFPFELTRRLTVMAATLSLVFFGQFISRQLALPDAFPRLSRYLLSPAAGGIMMTLTLVLTLSPPYPYVAGLLRVLWMVWLITLLGLVGVLSHRGDTLARLFLWAFAILFAGVSVRFLRNIGVLEPGLITNYSFQLAVLLHMLTVSVVIIFRYNALKQALVVEQAARQQQRDFVAMVSHEFRTPLAIISTSAQQIANNLDAPRDKTMRRCNNLRAAARRMTALMDDYLSLDRIDGDLQPLQLQDFNVERELQLSAAERPPGRVQLTVNDLPAHVRCDPSLVRIALHNLLANADRHAPMDQAIELHACGDGRGGLSVTVTDHGEGVANDELAHLFVKYFRGRSAQRRPGAGLGLYLVKSIAELHGGTVTVVNAPAGGAVFTLTLPSQPAG